MVVLDIFFFFLILIIIIMIKLVNVLFFSTPSISLFFWWHRMESDCNVLVSSLSWRKWRQTQENPESASFLIVSRRGWIGLIGTSRPSQAPSIFHVPRPGFCSRGSDLQGRRLRQLPNTQCTQPFWPLLQVESPWNGVRVINHTFVPLHLPPMWNKF